MGSIDETKELDLDEAIDNFRKSLVSNNDVAQLLSSFYIASNVLHKDYSKS